MHSRLLARGRLAAGAAAGPPTPLLFPGLAPPIHVFGAKEYVDARVKPGHDGVETCHTGMTGRDRSLAAVDLAPHQRDGLLIDACGVPGLDGGKVRLARLVAGARAPAVRPQEIRGGVQ